MSELETLVPDLKKLMQEAGDAIMEVYEAAAPLEVENKSDDSPVTQADYAAHHVLDAGLKTLTPDYPVLSEEGGLPDFETRSSWQRYWLVDPLDGTKEFINRNGEFTVNIALIESGEAIFGMVFVPVKNTLYYGGQNLGAWKEVNGESQAIRHKPVALGQKLNVVGSRRHGAEALEALLEKLKTRFESIDLVSMGSSLKICALAEGTADWYPRLALTSEWDTAAAHAVLSAAGGKILDEHLNPLRYNEKTDILNPFFHAFGDGNFDWEGLLKPLIEK